MKRRWRNSIPALAVASAVAAPHSVLACAVCFGQTDSKLAVGMNMGILALLAVIGTVLAIFATFFIFLARRAARFGATAAPSPLPNSK